VEVGRAPAVRAQVVFVQAPVGAGFEEFPLQAVRVADASRVKVLVVAALAVDEPRAQAALAEAEPRGLELLVSLPLSFLKQVSLYIQVFLYSHLQVRAFR
jgi:hypothetical protein